MKKTVLLLLLCFFAVQMYAQSMAEKLQKAAESFAADSQMKHGILGLYVANATTGERIYAINGDIGLPAASTQKIFTAIAAFDKLGKDFKYTTELGYNGTIDDSILNGNIIIKGYGDPTLGSWRYEHTKQDSVLYFVTSSIAKAGIKQITGNIILSDTAFTYMAVPGGWMWEDMGNYYGAGSWAINWHENQFDLTMKADKTDDDTTLAIKTEPALQTDYFYNFVKSDVHESGDGSLIYVSPYSNIAFADGGIAAGKTITASGSFADPAKQLAAELLPALKAKNIILDGKIESGIYLLFNHQPIPKSKELIGLYTSPSLDSIIHWFLRKSINMYGESLLKTMGYFDSDKTETKDAVKILQHYWEKNGVEASALSISDGSGLSPQNRVTAAIEAKALLYAKHQSWFESFYDALPTYNNMKLKSGTINKVKAFAGYHTSAKGQDYVVSIIVNNYSGETSDIIKKMYKVLDVLK